MIQFQHLQAKPGTIYKTVVTNHWIPEVSSLLEMVLPLSEKQGGECSCRLGLGDSSTLLEIKGVRRGYLS